MPVYSIGGARESVPISSETYKEAIEEYLRCEGFVKVSDSAIDGQLADQIYRRALDGERETWVEAKNTSISLGEKEFLESWKKRGKGKVMCKLCLSNIK